MKSKYLFIAAVALTLAACAKQQEIPVEETQPMAVSFDAYLNRAVTKADPTTATNIGKLQSAGFGIFAYYTDNDNYDGTTIPNFMYNQKVDGNPFSYSPLKYWPNEYGATAIAEESDRISFFAYAPFAQATPASGKVDSATNNIIGFTKNNYAGDPLVKYVVDLDPSSSVDLVWGRQPGDNSFKSYDNTQYATPALEGLPWLNVRRPKFDGGGTGTKEVVKFVFDHALAALNVTVDHYANQESWVTGNNVEAETRIWIRSITFTGFATEGALNLNNTTAKTALWESINGEDLITGDEVTIFDGRKDGKEGTTSASSEKYLGLNPNLVQMAPYANASGTGLKDVAEKDVDDGAWLAVKVTPASGTDPETRTYYSGVLSEPQNLFESTNKDLPVYVIPTGDPVKVTIAYDVETKDSKLATYLSDNATKGSSISNVITKTILTNPSDPTSTVTLENGKQYIIKLHLGMNSVKVDAAVTGWGDGATGSADLPTN